MRITGGDSRGRVIAGPSGLQVRPTASKIRQAFFNILRHKVPNCRFLDLCAGSGLMGIEALSRGAQALIAVEESRSLVKAIEANLQGLGYEAEVICGDVRKVIPILTPESFDIVFADPPYKSQLPLSVLQTVERFKLLAESGVLSIEHAREVALPNSCEALVLFDRRTYGQTAVSFYKRG